MYSIRDRFVIPFTCTCCENLVPTKTNFSPKIVQNCHSVAKDNATQNSTVILLSATSNLNLLQLSLDVKSQVYCNIYCENNCFGVLVLLMPAL